MLNISRSGRGGVFSLLWYFTSRPYTGGVMGFAVGGSACGGAPLGPPCAACSAGTRLAATRRTCGKHIVNGLISITITMLKIGPTL